MNKNPIFVEYYSHLECDCYKIELPWSSYAYHKLVLCKVSEGLEKAKELALKALTENLTDALSQPIEEKEEV